MPARLSTPFRPEALTASAPARLGPLQLLALVTAYSLVLILATWPRAAYLATHLPTLCDPMTHIWVMKWIRTAVAEGHSPLFHPGVQAPLGLPLGLNPPMPTLTAFYLLLSLVTANDVLIYNILWFASLVFAAVGSFLLARAATQHTGASFIAGLGVMLATPLMLHGYEHLELLQVGWFALFLLAWIRFIDAPTPRRLGLAIAGYLLVAMGAPYFGVLAIFPATLYVAGAFIRAIGQPGGRAWQRARLGWLTAFVALVLPALPVLFYPQVWAATHGYGVTRTRAEFESYGTTLWSYVTPTSLHALGRLLPFDILQQAGFDFRIREKAAYLGLVPLALLYLAASRGTLLSTPRFWWTCLSILVLLSMGASTQIDTTTVPLPAGWLYDHFPPFRLLRVPARFNLFVPVVAGVIAAGALASLLNRIGPFRARRAALLVVLSGLLCVDLAILPYGTTAVPAMPRVYEAIRLADPEAIVLDAPVSLSSQNFEVSPLAAYWQGSHRLRTLGGYASLPNSRLDERYAFPCPLLEINMLHNPGYLADPDHFNSGIVADARFHDLIWLYARTTGLRHLVLHEWSQQHRIAQPIEQLQRHLAPILVDDDPGLARYYDLARLPVPQQPVVIPTEGWGSRSGETGRIHHLTATPAELAVYRPESGLSLAPPVLHLELQAAGQPRRVSLQLAGRTLASWTVPDDQYATFHLPLDLPLGLSTLTLQADGDPLPADPAAGAREPSRLRVSRVQITSASAPVVAHTLSPAVR